MTDTHMKSPKSLALVAISLFLLCGIGLRPAALTASASAVLRRNLAGVRLQQTNAGGQAQNQQNPQQNPQGPPSVTFQVEVNYVDVDAIVTDEQGNFIGGLTRDDFEVFEDGKPQKIDMFSLVEIPVEKPERFRFLDKPVSTDARSNRQPFSGRVYVIVLDDLDVSPLRTSHTRKAAREFIEQYFGANDMAAVVYTSGRTDAGQEFTSDRQLLLASVDKFVGRRLRSATLEKLDAYYQKLATTVSGNDGNDQPQQNTDPGGHSRLDPLDLERGFRALGVLDTLKNLSEFLASVRGRRKALLLFSEGVDYAITDLFGTHSATDVVRATQDAITMAARSNVNFFTIDPRGLVGMTSEFMDMQGSGAPELLGTGPSTGGSTSSTGELTPMNAQVELMNELRLSQDNLRTLAEETGGIAAVNSNSLTSAFDRIVESNSRYYVLGYYPPTHPRDGRFHKIEVRVKRPGLKVAARRGYASPRGKTAEERRRDEAAKRARDAKRPDADNTSPALREVLGSAMQQSGLTFSVQAAAFKNTPKEASVALAIDIDGERLQFDQQPNALFANNLELSLFSVNEYGKAQKGVRSEVNLTLKPETVERVKTGGIRVNPRIALAPGRYQMRIGARETVAGQMGSVFYDLEVPDFRKQRLMLSGLLLTAASIQQTVTVQPDPLASKLLPAAATSRRQFSQNDMLALYAELYDNITSKQGRQIDVNVRLISETGQEVFTVRDSLSNGATAGVTPWTIYGYAQQIPLKNVPPGRYLLRVEAQVRGNVQDAKPAARETLITVAGS
jgi:VWFA-related protein